MDSFLDLARASFCRLSEEVHQLAADYRAAHDLPALKVSSAGCHRVATSPFETLCDGATVASLARHARVTLAGCPCQSWHCYQGIVTSAWGPPSAQRVLTI